MPDNMQIPILLKMGDNISTDEILAGGSRVFLFVVIFPKLVSLPLKLLIKRIITVVWKVSNMAVMQLLGGQLRARL